MAKHLPARPPFGEERDVPAERVVGERERDQMIDARMAPAPGLGASVCASAASRLGQEVAHAPYDTHITTRDAKVRPSKGPCPAT